MADVSGFGLSMIGQIAVKVQDLDRAVAFYRDRLGMRFLFQAPPGLVFFDAGGVRLMLSTPEGEAGGTSILYFKVDDIHRAAAVLKDRGVAIVSTTRTSSRRWTHTICGWPFPMTPRGICTHR